MRLLSDIRFGTERYPEKVARRLRTVNIGTRLATAFHAFSPPCRSPISRSSGCSLSHTWSRCCFLRAFRCSIAWALR